MPLIERARSNKGCLTWLQVLASDAVNHVSYSHHTKSATHLQHNSSIAPRISLARKQTKCLHVLVCNESYLLTISKLAVAREHLIPLRTCVSDSQRRLTRKLNILTHLCFAKLATTITSKNGRLSIYLWRQRAPNTPHVS